MHCRNEPYVTRLRSILTALMLVVAGGAFLMGALGCASMPTAAPEPLPGVPLIPSVSPEGTLRPLIPLKAFGGECFDYVPPPLFDTSDNDAADPRNPRAHGIELIQWNGSPYLIYNVGNDMRLQGIANPLTPYPTRESHYNIYIPDDRDYNLFNFSVCDECRYGFAGFEWLGSVLFDMGAGAHPNLYAFRYHPAWGLIGAFTFKHSGQQYLVANSHPLAGCGGSTPALMTFDGTALSDQQQLQCLGAGFVVYGGRYIPASASDDGSAYVYIADSSKNVRIFKVTGSGTGMRLEYRGAPMNAGWFQGSGLRVDLDADPPLAAAASGYSLTLWDIEDTDNPIELHSWPFPYSKTNLAAVEWPYLWAAVKGSSNGIYVYDIRDPTSPTLVDPGFWDPFAPWNNINRASIIDAVFTDDAAYLFLSRFSVVQRVSVCTPFTEDIFNDGFETGDAAAWSSVIGG